MRLLITRLTPVQPSHMLRIRAFCSFVNIHTRLKNSVVCHFQLIIPWMFCLTKIFLVCVFSIFTHNLLLLSIWYWEWTNHCYSFQLLKHTAWNTSILYFSIIALLHTMLFPFAEDHNSFACHFELCAQRLSMIEAFVAFVIMSSQRKWLFCLFVCLAPKTKNALGQSCQV